MLSDWTLNVKGLPAGYKLIKSGKQLVKGRPESALHLLFSDGLSAVSVFFEPQAAETGMPPGAYRQGETALFVSVASGHRTVSMGEVPLTAVQQFGEKLILQPIK